MPEPAKPKYWKYLRPQTVNCASVFFRPSLLKSRFSFFSFEILNTAHLKTMTSLNMHFNMVLFRHAKHGNTHTQTHTRLSLYLCNGAVTAVLILSLCIRPYILAPKKDVFGDILETHI